MKSIKKLGKEAIVICCVSILLFSALVTPAIAMKPEESSANEMITQTTSDAMKSLPTEDASYVIITTNDIVANSEELQHFINMKILTGHTVKVVTENDFIGLTGQYPNDRADKIRQWLINNYQTLGIEYVLLIGDPDPDDTKNPDDHVGEIPMKMTWPRYFRKGSGSPTDLYFGDLDSNWDSDGDGFYFESKPYDDPKSPHPSIDEDTFSVFWTGEVKCDFNVEYTFKILSDDGVLLTIDGVDVIDNWVEHELVYDEWTNLMTVGKHDINLSFRENYGDGIIKLFWKTQVDDEEPEYIKNQIIPSDHLYDIDGNQGGLTGLYYNNNDFTDHVLTRVDPEIMFEWGTGDLAPGDPDWEAEVFVGRIPVYGGDCEPLDAILRKIIDYETDPENIDWRKSIMLPMVRMSPTTTSVGLGEAIMNDIAIPNGFSYYRLYEEDYASSGGPTPEAWPCSYTNVLDEWPNGYGMVTWHTHGGETSASHVIKSGHVTQLDDSKPAFTFQASCHNAWPENENNLAYSLLKQGGVAMVASTRMSTYRKGDYASFTPTSHMNHQMAYFYTDYIVDDGMPASKALNQVCTDQTERSANAIQYVLYGDPECSLLTVYPNEPPVADANGLYSGFEGSFIEFDSSGSSDLEGDVLDYRWDWENDGVWDTVWSTSPTISYVWGDDHTGTIALEVRDSLGKIDIDTTTVTIENVDPTTTFDLLDQPNPQFILPVVHDLTYHGSFTDPGWLDTHTATWDFGDGVIIPGIVTEEHDAPDSTGTVTGEHVYTAPGTYTITLTVDDDDGGTSSDSIQIEVVDEFGALQDLDEYIQNLPNSAFKNNPNLRKVALHMKVMAIQKQLINQAYNGAIKKLNNDIRDKADGLIDGNFKNDWIIDQDAQYHICMKIDDLTAYLEYLMG